MSSTTVTKSVRSGIKRKPASFVNGKAKDSKKAKTEKVTKVTKGTKIAKYEKPQHHHLKSRTKSSSEVIEKTELTDEKSSETSDAPKGPNLDPGKLNDGVNERFNIDVSGLNEDGLHPERAKAIIKENQSSKEAHSKQKQLAQERKAAKPLAEDLARTKKIWERLRRKSHVPTEERKELVRELFEIIIGRVKEFVLKHDSVRVVQTAIKYANLEQKRTIAQELSGTYCQLAESRYAKFLIGKLLVHGDNQIRDIIIPEFFGKVRRLIKHPEASWILDDVYRGAANKQQQSQILRECYGAEFALFQTDELEKLTADVSEIIKAYPGKRTPIMSFLMEFINQLIQKKMTGFTLLHDAMLQFFLNAKPGTDEFIEFIEVLKGDEQDDLLKNLAFTKSGSRLVCLILAHGTAKDRKHIVRTYKDIMQMLAADQYGHIILLSAYEVIDDTILTAKSIFSNLLGKDMENKVENVIFLANNINARIVLLYLYLGRSKSIFPSSHSSDLHILDEIEEIRKATSKKNPETRRAELIKELSLHLLRAIEKSASSLMKTSFGCQFLTAVLFGAQGDKSTALHAVASNVGGDPNSTQPNFEKKSIKDLCNEENQSETHVAITSHAGKMLKSLIAGGRFNSETKSIIPVVPALNFADILYPHIKSHVIEWAICPTSFVILALIQSNDFTKKAEVMEILKREKRKLVKAIKELSQQKHSETIISKPSTDDSRLESVTEKLQKGNKGLELLLELVS